MSMPAHGKVEHRLHELWGEIHRINNDYAVSRKVDGEIARIGGEIARIDKNVAGLAESRNQLATLNRDIADLRVLLSNALSNLGSTLLRAREFTDAEPRPARLPGHPGENQS